jgi:DNA-binding NtrC family response regulator
MIRGRDLDSPITTELSPGSAVLVGRNPDPQRFLQSAPKLKMTDRLVGSPSAARMRLLRVDAPRISSNHLYVFEDLDGTVGVCDLASRNGSWLRLEGGQPALISGAFTVELELAGQAPQDQRLAGPQDTDWETERDFVDSVVNSLSEWLHGLGIEARLVVSKLGEATTDESTDGASLPLGEDSELRILPSLTGTYDLSWSTLLERIRAYVHRQNLRLEQYRGRGEGMVVASRPLREVLRRVADAAAHGRRTVILGPTGVGKESLASYYHRFSPKTSGPFAALNCALLDRDLLYAQLFGARKGSFTGAGSDIIGTIEAAHEGTLFLDELGDMGLDVQKALLRFLDSRGEFQRLGDSRPRRANVQVVCATNAPLDEQEHRTGRFRDDLWYRLASAVIRVPPLRERREDILGFLRARTLRGSPLTAAEALSEPAIERVLSDPWPGNFRDLENFVERLPPTTQPRGIDLAMCEAALLEGRGQKRNSSGEPIVTNPMLRDSKPGRKPRTLDPPSVNVELDWRTIVKEALEPFLAEQGDTPPSFSRLQEFIEKYLKPVFIAEACDAKTLFSQGKAINYSALARRLNVADGSTIKQHLARYLELGIPPAKTSS